MLSATDSRSMCGETGTAKWRKTIYKSLTHARPAINRWAEGGIEKIN